MSAGDMPFRWHEHHDQYVWEHYRMERIHDRELSSRFPGLIMYSWHAHHDRGFWYHGQYIKDAILFYNVLDELVSVGFKDREAFILTRDDHRTYKTYDSFLSDIFNH